MNGIEDYSQTEYMRNAPILLKWKNTYNADMNELYAIDFGMLYKDSLFELEV